jgi:hypothetical protein
LEEGRAVSNGDGKSESHPDLIILPCICKIVSADSSLTQGFLPDVDEFVLIPKCEGTRRASSDHPS